MRLSLRTKWTATLLAVGAIPLGLLAWRSAVIVRAGLADAERQLQVAVIDHAAFIVDRTLEDAIVGTRATGALVSDPRIPDEARIALAQEALRHAGCLAQVALYTAEGELIDALGPEPRPLERLPAAVLGRESGSWLPVALEPDRAPLFRYAERIVREGSVTGWALGTVKPALLGAELVALSRDRFGGRPDGVLLLDGQARVIAGGGGEFGPGASLFGRDIFPPGQPAQHTFEHPFGAVSEYVDATGLELVGSVRSLPERGYALLVRRPASAVFDALRAARQALGVAVTLFVLAGLGIGTWLARRTTRPIGALVALAKTYARREFDARSTVRTGDELEALGASMTEMAQSIAESDRELARRAAIEANLSRYLPAKIAAAIAEGKRELALGGERRCVTVLFADVVSFTPFAEAAAPERAVAFLNELFSVLTEVVFRHEGTVDKFMGDCIMAIFGAPDEQPDHVERALRAAEDMHRFVEASGDRFRDAYGVDVRLGIGVASGEAIVGNLGSEQRMEYTAIGDVVNVASRLEMLARPGQTLVSTAGGELPASFSYTSLGEYPLRGRKEPVTVVELA